MPSFTKKIVLPFLLVVHSSTTLFAMDCDSGYQLIPLLVAFSAGVILTSCACACKRSDERTTLLGRIRADEKRIDKERTRYIRKWHKDLHEIDYAIDSLLPHEDVEGESARERNMREGLESLSRKISKKKTFLYSE